MLRVISMGALILVNFLLQTTVFRSAAVLGVIPDTALVFTASYGILRGDVSGALFGFCAGLTQDILAGYLPGRNALLGLLAGFVCGKPFRHYFRNHALLPFAVVSAAALGQQILAYCLGFLFLGKINFPYYFAAIILPKTIYTAVWAIPLYWLLHAVNARLEQYERHRAGMFKPKELP